MRNLFIKKGDLIIVTKTDSYLFERPLILQAVENYNGQDIFRAIVLQREVSVASKALKGMGWWDKQGTVQEFTKEFLIAIFSINSCKNLSAEIREKKNNAKNQS